MRITNQREIILEELRRLKSHPTADELYEVVKKRLPRISIATVYRNLERLSEAGMIHKLEYGGRQKRFDGDVTPHCHVVCVKCGRVSDVETVPEVDAEHLVVDSRGYKIFDGVIQFEGLCPKCQLLEEKKIN
ncbi:MAG: transcriptional repressor [Thermodesulfobacteria bacterium]|nr:transcriptional repressor [Thermodesulfobacteriota bacterium]